MRHPHAILLPLIFGVNQMTANAVLDILMPDTITVNKRPPVPTRLPVTVQVDLMLTNTSGTEVRLFAGRPCDVHFWRLLKADNVLIQTEPAEVCILMVVTRELGAREVLRDTHITTLDGHLLSDGQYILEFHFWGYIAQKSFEVRVSH